MIEIQEDEVVIGETYFVVCNDGVIRYLTVGLSDIRKLTYYAFYDVDGDEEYRTYSPYKIFKI